MERNHFHFLNIFPLSVYHWHHRRCYGCHYIKRSVQFRTIFNCYMQPKSKAGYSSLGHKLYRNCPWMYEYRRGSLALDRWEHLPHGPPHRCVDLRCDWWLCGMLWNRCRSGIKSVKPKYANIDGSATGNSAKDTNKQIRTLRNRSHFKSKNKISDLFQTGTELMKTRSIIKINAAHHLCEYFWYQSRVFAIKNTHTQMWNVSPVPVRWGAGHAICFTDL